MNPRNKKIAVITGASSGVGKATALAFAKAGYNLVLASRRVAALEATAQLCQKEGAETLVVPTDISNPKEVNVLASKSLEKFGHFDVWINDAGVYMDGRFTETPLKDYIRLFEVNLFGSIYGMRAALSQFEKQSYGTLINVSSVFGMVAGPYVSAYCASKFAIRAISQSLRAEYAGTKIKVCTVLPATLDTPLYQHAANFTGRVIRPVPPLYSATTAARVILSTAYHPKDEVFVGFAAPFLALGVRLFPGLAARIVASQITKFQLSDQKAPNASGNMFEPMDEGAEISGGWKK